MEPKRYKKPITKKPIIKKPVSKKESFIKSIILLVGIVILASFLVWTQFAPKPVEEAIEVIEAIEAKVEQVKKIETPININSEKEEPTNPEGVVTYAEPKKSPPKVETPVVVVEDRVEERNSEAVLASAIPKVYTIHTETQQGSGFLFNDKGDIITNAHVVAGYDTVTVVNSTGHEFVGRVIGISDTVDVALIRVETIAGKEPMQMDLLKAVEGTSVIAIGSPGNKANTATMGKVTGTGRDFNEKYTYTDLYEFDAIIAAGSSGGPLLDALTEKVIGINSVILTDNPALGYSIPIYSVNQLINSWVENPKIVDDSVNPPIEDAYFDKELLSIFIEGYTTLYTYAQNEVNFNYLVGYLLPDSSIYKEESQTIAALLDQGKSFTVNKFTVEDVKIEENRAIVTATTESVMTQPDKEPINLTERAEYEIIIDQYGDYMIQSVTKTDITPKDVPEEEEEDKEAAKEDAS